MIWQMDLLLILSKTERENGRWREYQRGTSGRGQGGRVSGDTGDNAGNALKEKKTTVRKVEILKDKCLKLLSWCIN